MNADQIAWNQAWEDACARGECTREDCDRNEYHNPEHTAPVEGCYVCEHVENTLGRYMESGRWAA